MKIYFEEKDTAKILNNVKSVMAGRKLGEIVSFDIVGNDLKVTISKLGTSTLLFAGQDKAAGTEFSLKEEKIAFIHKAFKDEVAGKIYKVVEQAGGKVTA